MCLRLLLSEADRRHLQASANNFSDFPHRYSPLGDRVVPAASLVLLQRKPVEASNIEDMRRRPAIESLANVRRGPLFTGHADRVGGWARLHRGGKGCGVGVPEALDPRKQG